MKFGSLFAGFGGIDLGLEWAGMEAAWQVEIDPYCQNVLAKHWPDVPRFGDVKEIRGWDLPEADLICGGFPCPPVSLAASNRRLFDDDERWLWPEFRRIICEAQPRWLLVENVSGLRSARNGALFAGILRDLAILGFDAEWESLPAAAFGAPHLRYRVFIVAHSARPRLEEREHSGGKIAGPLDRAQRSGDASHTDREGLRQQSGRSGRESGADPAIAGDDGEEGALADSDREGKSQSPGAIEESRRWAGHGSTEMADSHGSGCEERRRAEPALAEIRAAQSRGEAEPRDIIGVGKRGRHWWEDGYIGGSGEAWAIEPDVGRVADGISNRVERLRGLGNAVVPQIAHFLGERILEAEKEMQDG